MATYQEFEKRLKDSGMYDKFSQYDLGIAQSNPNLGYDLLRYKNDYMNATTEQARALANANAEAIRKQYNYLGGSDGMQYNPFGTQNPYQSTVPTVNPNSIKSPYLPDVDNSYSKLMNYPDFSTNAQKPNYNNRYDAQTQQLLQDILNRPNFSYDPNTDQNTKYYRQAYQREGKRAAENALGIASASTGGMASSYATTAASQANDYYASQLADKYPELYQAAYGRYMNELSAKRDDVSMLQGAEQIDYGKHLDNMNQFNTDRNFDYNKWLSSYDMAKGQYDTAYNRDNQYRQNELYANETQYGREQDTYGWQYKQDETAYNRQQNELERQRFSENTQYNRQQDDLDNAYRMANLGDFSALDRMGIDTTQAKAMYASDLEYSRGRGQTTAGATNGGLTGEGAYYNITNKGVFGEQEIQGLISDGTPEAQARDLSYAFNAFKSGDFEAEVNGKNVIDILLNEFQLTEDYLSWLNPNWKNQAYTTSPQMGGTTQTQARETFIPSLYKLNLKNILEQNR